MSQLSVERTSASLESPSPAPTTEKTAAALLDAVSQHELIYLAADEVVGRDLQRMVAAAAPEALVLFYPASDSLPGESAPPTPANAGERTAVLRHVHVELTRPDRRRIMLVSSGEAAARLTAPPAAFATSPPIVTPGQERSLEALAAELIELGYVADDRVDEPGEVGLRGQVLDVFPADTHQPFRIEVADGKVTAIRAFDAVTQLTVDECDRLELGRVSEPALGDGATLLDHLPGALLALADKADGRRRRFLDLAKDAGKRRPRRALRDICPDERWQAAVADHEPLAIAGGDSEPPPRFAEQRAPDRAFLRFARDTLAAGERLLIAGTPRDLRFLAPRIARKLKQELQPLERWSDAATLEPGAVATLAAPFLRGFRRSGLVVVAAADLLGSRAQRDDAAALSDPLAMLQAPELRLGDVVVHEDHGIGVVTGLQSLDDEGEAIVLRFAGDARRLVPVAEADRLWRYGADEDAVTLDKLDGSSWEKRRLDILKGIAETARGLVALAAEREKLEAPSLEPDPARYEQFAADFPFTETADQARAIETIRGDLASGKPMDRLLIGDVGYGKTEVALRAAAMAALAGRQVVIAAPTTVLARQHLETARERFGALGIEVGGLSRLTSASERKRMLVGIADGSIRVVVGTGAVAGKAVGYADLALVIVDEEQRFGAADKAKLRALGAGHVLTLSATPIPRTLQMALIGLQQVSVLGTPPARRQPIRTTIAGYDEASVRTALLREHQRGGQSFVVVPRIEDMADMAKRIAKAAPELELLQAHGKLPAAEIDEVMVRFAGGEGDVLLATNIIEAGLDVPRANTMLVWRADRFGLSQLHQLRGRVGRGSRRGQIYLLTEEGAEIAPRTRARLATLQAFDRLGAGFEISARDLDQRGAGDLLSDEQSGHVKLIGVDLYQHLLERALREARGEPADDWVPELNLGDIGHLPASWIPDEEIRVGLYARFARLADLGALERFEAELADRFGELPAQVERMLVAARLRVLARAAGIARLDAGPAAIAFTPRRGRTPSDLPVELEEKGDRFLLREALDTDADRLARSEELLAAMA
ncbi:MULTISPECIES: helicase-related protein [Sphingomonas]|uniref:helicase-related protein n=1 Tax=Sphingomonas TaxID=13687 RepID=UPI001F080FC9|nr:MULTISPECIES: helicase-related protein [Sphingomonas]